jgi:hypothetical protein
MNELNEFIDYPRIKKYNDGAKKTKKKKKLKKNHKTKQRSQQINQTLHINKQYN